MKSVIRYYNYSSITYNSPSIKVWRINSFGFKEIQIIPFCDIPKSFIKQGLKEVKNG